jgi:hypothetical protein
MDDRLLLLPFTEAALPLHTATDQDLVRLCDLEGLDLRFADIAHRPHTGMEVHDSLHLVLMGRCHL